MDRNYQLRMENGKTMLLSDLPPRAIALDGAVQGPEQGADDRWSFDHHGGCLRLVTGATCEQVRRAIVFGLDIRDRVVVVNDIDGDTLLSVWLLDHPERVHENSVRDLVRAVGAVDAHGPAGYLELNDIELGLAETFFSPAGVYGVFPRNVQEHFAEWPDLLENGLALVDSLIVGEIEAAPRVAPEFERLFDGEVDGCRCVLVCGGGYDAFGSFYRDGYDVVVVTDGKGMWTIGKRSDLVQYHLGPHTEPGSLLGRLLDREAGWGGGSSIGGSPRPQGSALTPDEIWKLVSETEVSSST